MASSKPDRRTRVFMPGANTKQKGKVKQAWYEYLSENAYRHDRLCLVSVTTYTYRTGMGAEPWAIRLTAPKSGSRRLLIDHAAFHHEWNVLNGADIGGGIALHRDDVRIEPGP